MLLGAQLRKMVEESQKDMDTYTMQELFRRIRKIEKLTKKISVQSSVNARTNPSHQGSRARLEAGESRQNTT